MDNGSDDYELLPRQELESLRKEVSGIKKNSLMEGEKGRLLIQSIDNLAASVNRLIAILDDAQTDIITEYQKSKPAEKLDQLLEQNETIAKALIKINDNIRGGSSGQMNGPNNSNIPNNPDGLSSPNSLNSSNSLNNFNSNNLGYKVYPPMNTTSMNMQNTNSNSMNPGMNSGMNPGMNNIPSAMPSLGQQPMPSMQDIPSFSNMPPLEGMPPMDMPAPKKKFLGLI